MHSRWTDNMFKGHGNAKYHSRWCNMSSYMGCAIPQLTQACTRHPRFYQAKSQEYWSTFKYDGTQHLLNPSHKLIINMKTHLMPMSLTIPEGSHHNTDVTPFCIYFTHLFTHPVEKVQGFAGVQAAAQGDEDSGVGSPNCTSSQARGPKPAHHHGDGGIKGREGRRGKKFWRQQKTQESSFRE